jgi:hypothetical protein
VLLALAHGEFKVTTSANTASRDLHFRVVLRPLDCLLACLPARQNKSKGYSQGMTSPSMILTTQMLRQQTRLSDLPLLNSTQPGTSQILGMSLKVYAAKRLQPTAKQIFHHIDERTTKNPSTLTPRGTRHTCTSTTTAHAFRGVQKPGRQVPTHLAAFRRYGVCWWLPKVGHAAWRNVE